MRDRKIPLQVLLFSYYESSGKEVMALESDDDTDRLAHAE